MFREHGAFDDGRWITAVAAPAAKGRSFTGRQQCCVVADGCHQLGATSWYARHNGCWAVHGIFLAKSEHLECAAGAFYWMH